MYTNTMSLESLPSNVVRFPKASPKLVKQLEQASNLKEFVSISTKDGSEYLGVPQIVDETGIFMLVEKYKNGRLQRTHFEVPLEDLKGVTRMSAEFQL